MELSLRVEDSEARQMLNRWPDKLANAITGALQDATSLLLRELQTYPPTRPGQTYVRTGTLMRSWSRRVEGVSGVVGSNQSVAPYNRAVQDSEVQRPIFRGRWTNTAQGVVRRNERNIQEMFQARVRAEL